MILAMKFAYAQTSSLDHFCYARKRLIEQNDTRVLELYNRRSYELKSPVAKNNWVLWRRKTARRENRTSDIHTIHNRKYRVVERSPSSRMIYRTARYQRKY